MKNLDARSVIELVLLVLALVLLALRRAGVLYIPGLAAISLAVAMGLLSMSYIAQKNKSRKLAGILLLAFALLANEALFGVCNNAPSATGASHGVVMGRINL